MSKSPKSTSVLSLDPDRFSSAQLSNAPELETFEEQSSRANERAGEEAEPPEQRDASLTCNTCGLAASYFESVEDWKAHFKSDWHRHNLRRKLKGRPPITEAEFEKLVEDEGEEVSSISGSDSSDGEEGQHEVSAAGPRVSFTFADSGFTLWRCLLVPDRLGSSASPSELLAGLQKIPHMSTWAVILSKGGHFAAAVFEKSPDTSKAGKPPFSVKLHKTLHRYVVRAKAGGRQSTKDSSGKYAKSAGSRLRRYNEAALERDIQETLNSWKADLDAVDLVFYQAASADRAALFGAKQPPLNPQDERLRRIPFVTRRPTFSEVKRVAGVVTSAHHAEVPPSAPSTSKPTPQPEIKMEHEETHPRAGTAGTEESTCSRGADGVDGAVPSQGDVEQNESELHAAAREGDSNQVWDLLQAGHNPEMLDDKRKTPYQVAPTRATRNVFRRFMAQEPGKWNYKAAGIPSPLTEEMAAEQHGKKSSKKARARARKREMKLAAESSNPANSQAADDSDDEIARAVAAAAEEAARMNDARKAKQEKRLNKKKVGGQATSSNPNSKSEDPARRREMLAAAAERRVAALNRAANSQRLW